jgi:DNA-3-methyladenine glycosylase
MAGVVGHLGGTPLNLAAEPPEAARSLLGAVLRAGPVAVRLTEVEAYSGTGVDPASHAHRGRTPRNAVMFGPAGYAYVYFSYGMHWCMNVVTGAPGTAAAVLLRAGAVVDGLELARARRPAAKRDAELARGPARLCQALAVDGSMTGGFLLDGAGPLLLTPGESAVDPARIVAGPRVGVSTARDIPWRFWLADEPSVSVYRAATPRRRSPGKG